MPKAAWTDFPSTRAAQIQRKRLDSVSGIYYEISRLYRDTREGRIGTEDGRRLGALLRLMYDILQGAELERRLATVEAAMEVSRHVPHQ